VSINLLRTLIAVADTGSFRAAADRVHVTQAAVGQQMRRLEDHLGADLFDRRTRTPKLNPLGHAVVTKARDVVSGYDTLLDGLVGDARLTGELSVGAVPSLLGALVPISIKRLIMRYPDLHVRVVPGLNDELEEQVERGAVDAVLVSEPVDIPSGLVWHPFAREEFVLVTAQEVTEDNPGRLLKEMPYIRHQRQTAAGKLADEWLSRNQVTVNAVMEMRSLETVSGMVAHNLGVSVVPDACVPDAVFATLRKIRLHPDPVHRVLGVLTRAENAKIRLVEVLLDEINATVAEFA
jgi:DNA-binding transcriptional LysR family regulator